MTDLKGSHYKGPRCNSGKRIEMMLDVAAQRFGLKCAICLLCQNQNGPLCEECGEKPQAFNPRGIVP